MQKEVLKATRTKVCQIKKNRKNLEFITILTCSVVKLILFDTKNLYKR